MTRRWFIYALRDPITWDVRYVGKANDPAHRFKRHLTESPQADYRSGRWLLSLRRRGLSPMLELLDSGLGLGHGSAETAWIAEFKRRGADLTNTARGGIGGSGPCSEATRRKLSEAQRGKPRPAGGVAKMAISMRGKKQSPAAKAVRAAAMMGHKVSAETRAKIAATKIGKPRSPETIAKMSAARLGQTLPETTRQKLRVSQRERRRREAEQRSRSTSNR